MAEPAGSGFLFSVILIISFSGSKGSKLPDLGESGSFVVFGLVPSANTRAC